MRRGRWHGLLLAAFVLTPSLRAQNDTGFRYWEERQKGDLAAHPFRRELERLCRQAAAEQYEMTLRTLESELGPETRARLGAAPALELHPRMVSKYGKGPERAYAVVPGVARRLVELHTLLRASAAFSRPSARLNELLSAAQRSGMSEAELAQAAACPGPRLYLGFWGYFTQSYEPPRADEDGWEFFVQTNGRGDDYVEPDEAAVVNMLDACAGLSRRRLRVQQKLSLSERIRHRSSEFLRGLGRALTDAPR